MQRAKEWERAASPGPTYMSTAQMSNFLQDLRTNRPTRPVGSRPPPAHFKTWSARDTAKFVEPPTAFPFPSPPAENATDERAVTPQPAPEPKTHRRTTSNKSIDEVLAGAGGRALVQPPRGRDMSTSSQSRERTPSIQYRENGRRKLEREEARELRLAMEELELKAEQGLYDAARDEAAELVWKHINPHAPGNNPDAPYVYPGLTRKASHTRSSSVGRGELEVQELQRSQSKKLRKRNSMGSSVGGSRSSSLQSHRTPSGSSITANAPFSTSPTKDSFKEGEKLRETVSLPKISSNPSDISQRRRTSGGRRKISGSLFKNPNDQIYEEPEEETKPPPSASAPPSAPAVANPPPAKMPLQVRRNPFSRVQFAKDNLLVRSNTDPTAGMKPRLERVEIQRNPPSQSRNAAYTLNSTVPAKPKPEEVAKMDVENEPEVKMKDGKEIRSEDIRAATGFKLKDRSPKLPTPTLVSDKPGRPIVSFSNDWKPKEIELKQEISLPPSVPKPVQDEPAPRPLTKAATVPIIPTINFPDEPRRDTKAPSRALPSTSVSPSSGPPPGRFNRTPIPTISVYEDPPSRPLPRTSRTTYTPPSAAPSIPTLNVTQAPPTRSKSSPAYSIPTISVQETPPTVPEIPTINVYEDPPSRPLPRTSRTANNSSSVAPPIPTLNISPPGTMRSKSSPAYSIPTISVQETPTISVSPADRRSNMKAPSISVTPSVPTISINEPSVPKSRVQPPSISVTPSVPSINVNGPPASKRPLPTPGHSSARGISRPFQRNNTTPNQSHWTPTAARGGALCAQCALPIAGRIVSAAGARFHPECFQCHHCGEHLECVAFYPEPDNKYAERVARIHARQRGEDIEFLPTHPTHEDMMRLEQEDGDESKRFYCHLDFHEFFSPRCKSCKTPIEGEVVVACGAEWHVGHFFCAQCGDPFDSSTPFVEKEGYAWCVGCHTNRYSAKCKKCRKPVTDTVVKALGAEWHVGCFCCVECSGPFDDGRYFLRGESQDPVCVKCEERRLKA